MTRPAVEKKEEGGRQEAASESCCVSVIPSFFVWFGLCCCMQSVWIRSVSQNLLHFSFIGAYPSVVVQYVRCRKVLGLRCWCPRKRNHIHTLCMYCDRPWLRVYGPDMSISRGQHSRTLVINCGGLDYIDNSVEELYLRYRGVVVLIRQEQVIFK